MLLGYSIYHSDKSKTSTVKVLRLTRSSNSKYIKFKERGPMYRFEVVLTETETGLRNWR